MITAKQGLRWQTEQVSQPQSERIQLPRVLTITALIFVGLFVVATSLVFITRSATSPVDPFDAYANILPGQRWANVEANGFECGVYYDGGDQYSEECILSSATGVFSRINITRDSNVIDGVVFIPRKGTLALGDVVLAFGVQPRWQSQGNSWIVNDYRVVVWMNAGWVNYLQPVRAIYLYYRPLPDLDGD